MVLSLGFTLTACHRHHPAPVITPPPTEQPQTQEQPPATPRMEENTGGETTLTDDQITRMMKPVFFDFDKSEITDDQVPALQNNASVMKANPAASVLIEGHCDERGTSEYNL